LLSEEIEPIAIIDAFSDAAYSLYVKIRECREVKRAPLATYKELQEAFLPTRTKETVEKVCDKIAKSAEEMFANSELLREGAEPSCSALGLDEKSDIEDKIYNRCNFAGTPKQPIMVCDCPDGYGEYTPQDYAKEHMVKCYEDVVHVHYSDYPETLAKGYRQYMGSKQENDVSGMVIGCDAMVNAVHTSGPLAKFFVKSGTETLQKLAEAKE